MIEVKNDTLTISQIVKKLTMVFKDESLAKRIIMDYFVDYFPATIEEYDSLDHYSQEYLMFNFLGSLKDKYCMVSDEEWESIEKDYFNGDYESLRNCIFQSDKQQGIEDFKNYIEELTFEFLLA